MDSDLIYSNSKNNNKTTHRKRKKETEKKNKTHTKTTTKRERCKRVKGEECGGEKERWEREEKCGEGGDKGRPRVECNIRVV